MEEASYEGVRVFVVAATGAYSFGALRDRCVNPLVGLAKAQFLEPVFLETEVVPELMHDRNSHFTRNSLGRGKCPLQRSTENSDSVWRNQVVHPTTMGERHSLIQAEQGILIPCGGTIEPGGNPGLRDLISGWLVLNDDVHVVEHGYDLSWEAIQRTGDNSLKPLLPRALDTVSNPILHTGNDTSFGVMGPIYGEQRHVRTAVQLPSLPTVHLTPTRSSRNQRYTHCYDQFADSAGHHHLPGD